jgi:hypothetical protein
MSERLQDHGLRDKLVGAEAQRDMAHQRNAKLFEFRGHTCGAARLPQVGRGLAMDSDCQSILRAAGPDLQAPLRGPQRPACIPLRPGRPPCHYRHP